MPAAPSCLALSLAHSGGGDLSPGQSVGGSLSCTQPLGHRASNVLWLCCLLALGRWICLPDAPSHLQLLFPTFVPITWSWDSAQFLLHYMTLPYGSCLRPPFPETWVALYDSFPSWRGRSFSEPARMAKDNFWRGSRGGKLTLASFGSRGAQRQRNTLKDVGEEADHFWPVRRHPGEFLLAVAESLRLGRGWMFRMPGQLVRSIFNCLVWQFRSSGVSSRYPPISHYTSELPTWPRLIMPQMDPLCSVFNIFLMLFSSKAASVQALPVC